MSEKTPYLETPKEAISYVNTLKHVVDVDAIPAEKRALLDDPRAIDGEKALRDILIATFELLGGTPDPGSFEVIEDFLKEKGGLMLSPDCLLLLKRVIFRLAGMVPIIHRIDWFLQKKILARVFNFFQ